jgi:hypothetical protein
MFARILSLALVTTLPSLATAQEAPAAAAPSVPMVMPSQCATGGTMRVLGEAAPIRVAPGDTAGIRDQLRAGIALCVLPGESRGYLRVVLGDGRSGYLRSNSLAAEGTPPSAEASPVAHADPAKRLQVRDLDHLAVLVKDDPASAAETSRLLGTRKAATWTVVGAGAVALTGVLVGFLDPWRCSKSGTCSSAEPRSTTATTVMVSSLVIGVVGGVVGMVLYPTNSDLNAVIGGYNGRHGKPELELAGTSATAAATPVR